jgi:NADPH:quinone reductase-like Zn-dependent oxidoreductase
LHTKRLHLFGVSNKLRPPAARAETVRAFARDFLPYFASGRLEPVIDKVFAFDDIAAARAHFESSALLGKVVVKMQA